MSSLASGEWERRVCGRAKGKMGAGIIGFAKLRSIYEKKIQNVEM